MNRWRTALLGRTTSYRLNAYDDADIADALVAYVTTGTQPIGELAVARRAREYIATTEDAQRLLIKAYTLRWFNGLANLMWARAIERLGRLPCLLERDGHYDELYENGPIDVFFWRFLLVGSLEPVATFVNKYAGYTLSPRETIEEIIAVQHANTAENHACHDDIMAGRRVPTNPKVSIIQQLAEERQHPDAFRRVAAKTQIAAGKWDSAFTALLRLRF